MNGSAPTETTSVRRRVLSALIVGASGPSVRRIVTAFEGQRITTMRTDTVAEACERVPVDMPHVVLVLVPPGSTAERDALADRSAAVGAAVVPIDPRLDDVELQQILDRTIQEALVRHIQREAAEMQARADMEARAEAAPPTVTPPPTVVPPNVAPPTVVPPELAAPTEVPPPEDLDEGWDG